jgi:hypothetical protein
MLEVQTKGDSHPKTFVLKTDDADGELDRIKKILDDIGVFDDGDPLGEWFNEHSADQFAEGVEVPQDFAVDFFEIIDGDFPQGSEAVEKAQADAMSQLQGGDDD